MGHVLSCDLAQAFAIVELASDAPAEASSAEIELIARSADLKESGRLKTSRHVRGRTLGTHIIAGQPAPGDEVVWLAP